MVRPGDELIGLTRAFLYAGARSVLVTLWSVDAASAQDLILEFYRNMLPPRSMNKALALRQAQMHIMKRRGWGCPRHWAPFILIGDWR